MRHLGINAEPSSRKIHFCDQWESQPAPTAKNLSALLLDTNGKLIAWGYDARRLWLTQGAALRNQGARYHHGFKMDLGVRPAPQTTDDSSVDSDSSSAEPMRQGAGSTETRHSHRPVDT